MSDIVEEAISRFFRESSYPVLFTGAGVSSRAGLPTWTTLIKKLAEGIRARDPLTTQQMHECINQGNLTLAVDYFRLSTKVLDGDKNKLIKLLLRDYKTTHISGVARLPFKSCLTTNFDRSILDAIAEQRGRTALDFKLGDASFKQAQWEDGLYVARIHGAVEAPDSIVLSDRQFTELLSNESYTDLLRACFLTRNVLFLGFSFYDPAIRHIFNDLDAKFGSASSGRHLAILPEDAGSEFLHKAHRLNIEIVKYDPANDHLALWEGIQRFQAEPKQAAKSASLFITTKRYLAASLARARTQDASTALRESVAEGIISAILQDASPNAVSKSYITERVRTILGIKAKESQPMINRALDSLRESELCLKLKTNEDTKFAWKGVVNDDESLESSIRTLAESAQQRAKLQERWTIDATVFEKIKILFRHLVERRGWDLGAAFASGRPPEGVDLDKIFDDCNLSLAAYDRERLLRVLTSIIQTPTIEEARILSELGRVSFALELAFKSPQSILVRQAVLPRQIYFDASVLLPAIVTGHPFQMLYQDAIRRLRDASAAAAIPFQLSVCSTYLNEIISHKRNAEDLCRALGKDFDKAAHRDALYHGSANSNVYIGAYANLRAQQVTSDFTAFLKSTAPYKSEAELRHWLSKKGFVVVEAAKANPYSTVYAALERSYSTSLVRGKNPILIEHDAIQLARLIKESADGNRTLLITADRQLRDAAPSAGVRDAAEIMMSHVGLIQFIEVILGGVSDGIGLAQLLWSSRVSDRSQAVRAYFTTRALEHYDAGIAMAMPMIVEEHARIAREELDRQGADLESDNPKARAKALKILGTLESNYFSSMNAAIEKFKKNGS